MINEHDITKNMLSTIRKAGKVDTSGSLNEGRINEEAGDSIQLDGPERQDEINKLKQAVAPRVKVDDETPIIYPYDDEAVIRGEVDTIRFEMSVQNGLYITANSVKVNDSEILLTLKKLDGYFSVWKDEWPDRFPDYRKNNNM